jgi:hypothetical protein
VSIHVGVTEEERACCTRRRRLLAEGCLRGCERLALKEAARLG